MRIATGRLRNIDLDRVRRLLLGNGGQEEKHADDDEENDDQDCDPGHGFRLRVRVETGLLASFKAAV
jgi:hypothetical protein